MFSSLAKVSLKVIAILFMILSAMDSSIPGQESCQRMTGPLTDFVHKIVKS